MKRNLFISVLLLGAAALFSNPFELGLEFGYPTGISAKYWLNQRSALDFGLGFTDDGWDDRYDDRYDDDNRMHFHADYQLHRFDLIPVDAGRLGLYYGIGVNLISGHDSDLGVRIPLGAQYDFSSAPIAIFLEITPVVELTEGDLYFDPTLGIRYVFGKGSGSSKKSGKDKKKDSDGEEKEKPKVKMQW